MSSSSLTKAGLEEAPNLLEQAREAMQKQKGAGSDECSAMAKEMEKITEDLIIKEEEEEAKEEKALQKARAEALLLEPPGPGASPGAKSGH